MLLLLKLAVLSLSLIVHLILVCGWRKIGSLVRLVSLILVNFLILELESSACLISHIL